MNDWQTLDEWTAAPEPGRFAGHFPGHVVVPGAHLLDEVLWRLEQRYGAVHTVVQAKFARPMPPATAVRLQVAPHGGRLHFRLLSSCQPQAASFCAGVCLL